MTNIPFLRKAANISFFVKEGVANFLLKLDYL